MAGLFEELGIPEMPQPNRMAKTRFGLDTTKLQQEKPQPTGLFAELGIPEMPVDYVAQAKKAPRHLWNALTTGAENAWNGTMYVINDPDPKVSNAATMVNTRFGDTKKAQQLTQQHIANEPLRAKQREHYGKKIQQNDADLAQLSPYFNNDAVDGLYGGAASVVQQTPGILASIAARNPAPMMGQIGLQTYGPEYTRARQSGATRTEAELSSLGKTGLEVGTEYLPVAKGLKHVKVKGKLTKALVDQVAAEVPGELIAEAGQSAIDQHYGLNGRTAGDWNQYLEQLPSNLAQAGFGAISGSGIQAGAYHGAQRLANRGSKPSPQSESSLPPAQSSSILDNPVIQRVQQIMQRAVAPQQEAAPQTEKAAAADPVQAAMREVADEVYADQPATQAPAVEPPAPSRTEALRQQLTDSALGDIAPALIDNGQIVLHETAETLPVRPGGANPQGLTTEDGKIHLVADQLTPETAGAVVLHEGFHEGVKPLIGDAAWNKLMGNLSTLHQRAQRAGGNGKTFWRNAMRSVERANVDAVLTPEEFGAYAIEHYEQAPAGVKRWVDNTMGGMQAWAQQRFGMQVGQVTPAQLRSLAVNALRSQTGMENKPVSNTGKFSVDNPTRYIEAETALQKADRQHFDKMNRVHHVEKQVKDMGVDLPDWLSAYDAEIAYHGRRGERLFDFRKNEYQSLVNSMAENQITPERLDWYALARHAEERNTHIASINEGMPDGGSGMTTQQAKDLLSGKNVTMQVELADKNGKVYKESVTVEGFTPTEIQRMRPVVEQLDAMTTKSRQLMQEYGLESPDAVKAWSEQYKHYVPLAGKAGLDEYGGSPGKQSGFSVRGGQKRAAGRSSVAPNITEQVVRQVEDTINRGESNRVASNVVLFAKQLQKQGMPEAPNGKPLFEVNPSDLRRYFREGKLVTADMPATMGDDIVTARIDGKDVVVRVNDPVYAEAIRNLNAQQFDGAMKWLNKLTRSISLLYTGANPQFLTKAYIRDLATVGSLGQRYGNEIIAGAMKQQHTALKEAFQYEFTGKETDTFKQFRLLGGRTGFFNIERNLEQKRANLEKAIQAAGPINRHTAPEKLKRITSNTWDYYLASGSALESAVRYAVFRSALDHGRTAQEAAKIAKEITINFNRKGASNFAKNANAMYAFYNASLQGVRTTVIALKNKNVRRALYIYTSARTLGLIAILAPLDEDEREALLNNPEFRNAAIENFLIPTGDSERPYITLPFGPDLAFTGGASLGVVDVFYRPDRNGAWHAAEAIAQSLTRSFSPPPVSDVTRAAVNASPDNQGKAVMAAILPTAIKPAAQAYTGIDYLGRNIVPGSEFAKADPDAYKARTRNKTSWLSDFAIGLNELTGGDVARSGMIDVSPETFDTLFRGYGGGIYSMIRDGVEASTNPEKDWMDAPVIRQFIANPDALERGKATVARETMAKYSEMRAEIKKLRQNGLHAEADSLREKMNGVGDFAALSAGADKRLSALNKRENKLGRRTDAEATQIRAQIKASRKDIYQRINEASKQLNR